MMLTITIGGWEFGIEVYGQESILELKKKIELVLNVPVKSQTLSIWGCELIDGLDLDYYPHISHDTKIDLTINSLQLPFDNLLCKLQIVVNFSATKINIEVDITETVGGLKGKIHNMNGTSTKTIGLFFLGTELHNDYYCLTDYGISNYSEIMVSYKTMASLIADPPSRRLSIAVQTSSSLMNAAKIPLILSDLSTVNAMKQMLLSKKIIPQDDYIFIHKQRIMRESCSLRWHGVDNGDCLYVFKGTVSSGK